MEIMKKRYIYEIFLYSLQKIMIKHTFYTTSTHMGLPPEFKHINEGRKRN